LTDERETPRKEEFSNVIVEQYKIFSDKTSALVISNENDNSVQVETLIYFS
jgi:hypothetical protein